MLHHPPDPLAGVKLLFRHPWLAGGALLLASVSGEARVLLAVAILAIAGWAAFAILLRAWAALPASSPWRWWRQRRERAPRAAPPADSDEEELARCLLLLGATRWGEALTRLYGLDGGGAARPRRRNVRQAPAVQDEAPAAARLRPDELVRAIGTHGGPDAEGKP